MKCNVAPHRDEARMSIVVLTQSNISDYSNARENIGHCSGRRRKLWMSQYCKRYMKKSDYQGFAALDWRGLLARAKPLRRVKKLVGV